MSENFPVASLLPKELQQLGLSQAEAEANNSIRSPTYIESAPHTGSIPLLAQVH